MSAIRTFATYLDYRISTIGKYCALVILVGCSQTASSQLQIQMHESIPSYQLSLPLPFNAMKRDLSFSSNATPAITPALPPYPFVFVPSYQLGFFCKFEDAINRNRKWRIDFGTDWRLMQNNPLLQPIMSTCTSLLETITQKISVVEGKGVWLQDFWHAEAGTNGTILTLENANIFEKAMAESYSCNNTDCRSAGFTLALHPHHPLVPVWICQLHFYLSEKGTVQYRGNLIQYSYAPAGWMP